MNNSLGLAELEVDLQNRDALNNRTTFFKAKPETSSNGPLGTPLAGFHRIHICNGDDTILQAP